jgi:predicted CoA-binding protein
MIETAAKVTLVIGASTNIERYSYKAMHALLANGYGAIPMGLKKGNIAGLEIINDRPPLEKVHTVTLYINPTVQQEWQEYILSLKPKRIIFNPGTENSALAESATKAGIEVLEACTLVLLATKQY